MSRAGRCGGKHSQEKRKPVEFEATLRADWLFSYMSTRTSDTGALIVSSARVVTAAVRS
jgi:hypothetical protein